ncbi:MAG: dockerin type I repeat-containing protein [Clostridia bacterium]|nr:dockerin type I repeat-containing protein [Clostridia bacterium]
MKKLISVLLTVLMCFSAVTAFAETPVIDESLSMMGDANANGKVTAADARSVLRVAARIDPADSISLYNTDADGNGKISASDARIILRVAANLSEFVYGFDGNGTPCALNVLRSSEYYVKVSYREPSSSTTVSMSLAHRGKDVYIISDDMGFDTSELGFSECGMMLNDDKVYAIMGSGDSKIAMYIPDKMCEEMGMTKGEINEMSSLIASFIAGDIGTATKEERDGETVFCYEYELEGITYLLYVGTNGKLMSIDAKTSKGNETLIIFNEVAADSVSEYFNLDNYDLL